MLLSFFGMEFIDENVEQVFQEIRFWGVPICIFLTLFTIKPKEKREDKILKFFVTLVFTTFAFFIMVMLMFTGMCNWYNVEVMYRSKEDKELKIIRRNYGCGATDSGPPIESFFSVKKVNKHFNSVREINIEEIDLTKWNRN